MIVDDAVKCFAKVDIRIIMTLFSSIKVVFAILLLEK
jgi:hypothetical protein